MSGLVLFVVMAAGHYMMYDRKPEKQILQKISRLTQIPSASLSVSWYEPRIRLYEEAVNPAYPQMQPIDRMGFVYAE